ncbi:MAG TPA: YggT family protein [Nocardioidaceae bacterium]|jgi:YggT family protein|nr:YggT family protein [Nocardioidaceae bacterium]HKE70933.1 YggT family protein [Nocardioidaceae bacterium]
MQLAGEIIAFVLWVCLILLIARIVLDWVQMLARSWQPKGALLVLCEIIYSITDPPLRAIRRVLPPLRLGMVALDLSPLVLFVLIYILQQVNAAIFF